MKKAGAKSTKCLSVGMWEILTITSGSGKTLTAEGLVMNIKRPTHNFSVADLTRVARYSSGIPHPRKPLGHIRVTAAASFPSKNAISQNAMTLTTQKVKTSKRVASDNVPEQGCPRNSM
jgi:phage tail tape-measure protein